MEKIRDMKYESRTTFLIIIHSFMQNRFEYENLAYFWFPRLLCKEEVYSGHKTQKVLSNNLESLYFCRMNS